MDERRLETRKQINAPVRLYHPQLGRLDGITNDISEGYMAINLNTFMGLVTEPTKDAMFLRPINLDTLFPVSCLRQSDSKLVVKFLE